MANYLITGYHGEPHVTAENDRGVNAGVFGSGRYVLSVGRQLFAEYIGNNTVRLYDGKLVDGGAVAGIPAGQYIDLTIPEAGQGMNRNDLIVFQYAQDAATQIETGSFVVLHGEETSGTASDPELTQADLLPGGAQLEQMPLWRVKVTGTTISAPAQMFTVVDNIEALKVALAAITNLKNGGTVGGNLNVTGTVNVSNEDYSGVKKTRNINGTLYTLEAGIGSDPVRGASLSLRLKNAAGVIVGRFDAWENSTLTYSPDETAFHDIYNGARMIKLVEGLHYGAELPATGHTGRLFFKG